MTAVETIDSAKYKHSIYAYNLSSFFQNLNYSKQRKLCLLSFDNQQHVISDIYATKLTEVLLKLILLIDLKVKSLYCVLLKRVIKLYLL